MIRDRFNTFAKTVALNTGAAGTYNIGDVVDLQKIRDIGAGTYTPRLFVVVETTATSGGSATLQVQLVTDDNSAMSSPAVIAASQAIAVASLTKGTIVMDVVLPQNAPYERYIGIQQVTGTAAFTAGAISAFLVFDSPTQKNTYPAAI